MKTNQAGIDLIKRHERCVLRAYRDPGGVWTIGWGHTGGVSDGDFWSQDQCDRILMEDLLQCERAVSSYVHEPMNENQFSAFVSFVFNEGAGRFFRSSVLQRFNERDPEGACASMGLYTKMRVKGNAFVDSKELEARRADEQALFRIPVSSSDQKPA